MVCFDKALEIDPKYALSHNGRGNALLGLDRIDEAILAYDIAIEIDPDDHTAIQNKAIALSRKNAEK